MFLHMHIYKVAGLTARSLNLLSQSTHFAHLFRPMLSMSILRSTWNQQAAYASICYDINRSETLHIAL